MRNTQEHDQTSIAREGAIRQFYDDFSARFIEDIVLGNERVAAQLAFLSRAIPPKANVLVVGFGSGQVCAHIASRVLRDGRILGVDISPENLRIAQAIYKHPRVEYRRADITAEKLEGGWDAIVLPDVYEHIPVSLRERVHRALGDCLASSGKILLTVPSPGLQFAAAREKKLQIVDETVTLDDLIKLGRDIGGSLTYLNTLSIWRMNDYLHAVIARGADQVRPLEEAELTPLNGWPQRPLGHRVAEAFAIRSGLRRLIQVINRHRLRRALHTPRTAARESNIVS